MTDNMIIKIFVDGKMAWLEVTKDMRSSEVAEKVQQFIDIYRQGDYVPVPNFELDVD